MYCAKFNFQLLSNFMRFNFAMRQQSHAIQLTPNFQREGRNIASILNWYFQN